MFMKKELFNLINNLVQLQKNCFALMKPRVDYIISNNIVDKIEIEHLLDALLNICYDDESIKYYYKLCDYYDSIDKESSNFYRKELKKIL